MSENGADEHEEPIESILADLNRRAKLLLSELELFREYLRDIKQEQHIEVAHYRNTVKSELAMLERLATKLDDSSTQHIARSSNLPFLETIWNHVKRSKDVTALQKRVYFNSPNKSLSQAMHHVNLRQGTKSKKAGLKNAAVTVDAITDHGQIWVKVSLVTNMRMLFDLAKQGWTGTSDDEYSGDEGADDDDDTDVPLLKTTKDLCRAASSFRVRTRVPRVHLILPRIQPGETAEVDAILDSCRAAGAIIHCGPNEVAIPEVQEAFRGMVPDPVTTLSETLNIDCTILLALVSDFSHAKVSKEPWFHMALQRQVEIEGNENLLPSLLYPTLGNHKLVCTKEAAVRMREIVNTLGTPSETARTCILMGDDSSKSQASLVKEMQEWSAYEVPTDWQLPIKIVDQNEDDCQSRLPPAALDLSADMTPINKSVFQYGWATGQTTITSNRAVVKQIENHLERYQDLDASVFPSVWLCPTARSLVGKEKRGAKKDDNEKGAWPLPDPLRREQQRRHGLDILSIRAGHEVEDLRPQGYDCTDVIEAKNASTRNFQTKSDASETVNGEQ